MNDAIEAIEKLALQPGDIVLINVPKTQPLTRDYCDQLKQRLSELFPDGQRIYIKNADMHVEVLGDVLNADDIARIAARMEARHKTTGPLQSKLNRPEKSTSNTQ